MPTPQDWIIYFLEVPKTNMNAIESLPNPHFSFVYCQLGNIQKHLIGRQIFVPTARILLELQALAPWEGAVRQF